MPDRLRKTPSAALDDLGVPREDPDGCPYSLSGRIRWLAPTLARVRELEARVRELETTARAVVEAEAALRRTPTLGQVDTSEAAIEALARLLGVELPD